MRRALVVTGDDFGASPGVNAAIAAAHRRGILTSASLLVTGAALDEAVALAREMPGLSTGLHLALCDAAPASRPGAIPALVDASGRFPCRPARIGIAHFVWQRRRRGQLEGEIRAQLERYLATGLSLDHVDGHHHLHMHPVVFEILHRCLEDYGVRWLRLVHEDAAVARRGSDPWRGEIVAGIFAALAARHRRALARSGAARGPDRTVGLRATGHMDADEWLRLLPRLAASTVEVYAHPDRASERGRREEAALCAPPVRAAIDRAGYRLKGTRELGRAALGEAA